MTGVVREKLVFGQWEVVRMREVKKGRDKSWETPESMVLRSEE